MSNIRFQILGTISISGPNGNHQPTSPMQRALLAALLLESGRFLPINHLFQPLWDDPPDSAKANVRTLITGIRGQLERAEPGLRGRVDTMRGSGGSYRIRVQPGELDLHAFRHMIAHGRLAIRDGNLDLAIRTLEDALELWHGPFGEGMPTTQWISVRCEGLQDARLTALQDLFTAKILRGDSRMLTLDIERVIGEAPYREQLWLLMIGAHFLNGDVGAALHTVARCRTQFDEGQGLDLPARLEMMHRAVLNEESEGVHRLIAAQSRAALPSNA